MSLLSTQKLQLHDVFKHIYHPAINLEIVTITNNTDARAVGDSLLGKMVIWTGSAWKILASGDTLRAAFTLTEGTPNTINAQSIICPIYYQPKLTAALASGGTLTKIPILRRGPALVHNDTLDYASQTPATVKAILASQGIIVVDETGLKAEFAVL